MKLTTGQHILLDSNQPQALLFIAEKLQKEISDLLGLAIQITASSAVPRERILITLRVDNHRISNRQGYILSLQDGGILIEAIDDQGLFYGSCTLIQILQFYGEPQYKNNRSSLLSIPCMEIIDWPDYLNRGVMLDVSRDKVPTMQTIFKLVELLSSWKINQLQLYTEHTFAYQRHPEVWKEASPFTGEEILKLDAFCRDRFIELVPNQNSFGHLEHWLNHSQYNNLAEAPGGFDFPWGHQDGAFSLCPTDPRSIEFISGLYDELLPHFSSRQLNAGCDETYDLGQGRSKPACMERGSGRVYLDFLLQINNLITDRGFIMQFWGDMIASQTELIPELPNDCIALEWGYEADHSFAEIGHKFSEAGISYYVCPGTSSWNSIAGRTENCLKNLSNAAIDGLKSGASGYLITDWGDAGHWQMLPVSYLGFIAGAAFSWSYEANKDIDIPQALSVHAFHDPSNKMGQIFFDLGNLYREIGIEPENTSELFTILHEPVSVWKQDIEPQKAIKSLLHILEILRNIRNAIPFDKPDRSRLELHQRELLITIDLLQHACMRGVYGFSSPNFSETYLYNDLQRIIAEYQDIWLIRNRPGGLPDSLNYFNQVLKDYL